MTEKINAEKPLEKPKLIIDTNAFIKCLDLNKLSQTYEIYTSDMVFYEIKDKKAKEKFSHLLFEIKTKFPSKSASAFIKNFAQKTGDFISLSETDLEVIAIGYTLAEESGKLSLLRKNPPEPSTYVPTKNESPSQKSKEHKSPTKPESSNKTESDPLDKPVEQEVHVNEVENVEVERVNLVKEDKIDDIQKTEDINEMESPNKEVQNDEIKVNETHDGNNAEKEEPHEEESDDDDDDDEGWINPDNFSQHFFTSQKVAESENNLGIAIMTADFAMQNVILQIGIPLLSIDGLTIKQTKKWILECYSCYKLCKIMNREFCPNCGNHTLSKLSCTLNADGTYFIYRKANYKHKTRGLIYSIPKPKGGRNNNDLLLREDEFMLKKKNYLGGDNKDKKREKALFEKAQRDFENGFGFEVIKQEKYKSKKLEFGFGKNNPNDKKFAKKH